MIGYSKVPMLSFQGVWNKGNANEVPPGHLLDALNCRFSSLGKPYTREGTAKGLVFPYPIYDWMLCKRPAASSIGTLSELLICDGSGNYRNSTIPATVWLALAGGIGINGVNLFGRAYFCPIITGPAGGPGLYLYDGNQCRLAGGNGPPATPAMNVTLNGTGEIAAGTRTFWCAFETNTGFITPPGAQVSIDLTSAATLTLSNIPLGPAGNTIARYLLATQANGSIPYSIPATDGGIINDNTTTSVQLSFQDTDLQASYAYLQDLLTVINSGGYAMGAVAYSNRLFIWPGPVPGGGGSTIAGSYAGNYESFDQTSCYIIVNRDDGFNVVTAFVWNSILYICKDLGVWSLTDNGDEPSSWASAIDIDGSVSVPPKGIAYLSARRTALDSGVLVADKSGLLVFNGEFQRPELTWKVSKIWQSINQNAWWTVQVAVDPIKQCIYAAIPLGDATYPNYILFGDYSRAALPDLTYVDPMVVKWDLWKLPNNPTVLGLIDLTGENSYSLRIGSADNIGNVIQLDDTSPDDYGTAIHSYIQTGYLYPAKSKKLNYMEFISYWTGLQMNAWGSANLTPTLYGLNGNTNKSFNNIQLVSNPTQMIQRALNFQSQKASLRLESFAGKFAIDDITLYTKPMAASTPR